MIKVDILKKQKGSKGNGGTVAGGNYGCSTSSEADHASEADYAQEAAHSTSAAGLDGNSSVWATIKNWINSATGRLKDVFLSKTDDDTANGLITFMKGLVSKAVAIFGKGWKTATYDGDDTLNGHGAMVDENGHAVFQSIFARGFISAPKFVFNEINVTKAEQWNTNAYGTIESVDTKKRQITLHLEENEYGSVAVGDICRGIYADIDNVHGSDSNVEGDMDDCNFAVHKGFFTTYFCVEKIITSERGKCVFQYRKRTGTTPDPCPYMDFAQYGSFVDQERQSSMYMSSLGHSYIENLAGVNNWEILPQMRVCRYGWLGDGESKGLTIVKDDGRRLVLEGNGLFAQNHVYFGGAVIQLSNISDLDDLQKMAGAYDVSLSDYAGVITVDDMGNVINGLYDQVDVTQDDGTVTKVKQWKLHTAVYVRKGSDILLEEDEANENVSSGHYRVTCLTDGCEAEIANSTVYITSIKNLRDGDADTEEKIDYDAMRKMAECRVTIVVECEGVAVKTVVFPVRIVHDALPFMTCDLSNEHASVGWNTKAKKYYGLPVKTTATLMYHNEPWQIDAKSHADGLPDGLKATVALNGKKLDVSIDTDGTRSGDFLPKVFNVEVHISGTYAGAVYEYSKTLTIDKSADITVYELVPSSDSFVLQKDGTLPVSRLTCEVWATSSDDKRYKITDLAKEGLSIKYAKGSDTTPATAFGSSLTVTKSDTMITLGLFDSNGNILDKESLPVVAWGEDGKGVEFAYYRDTNGSKPANPTPSGYATSTAYQQGNYTDPKTNTREYIPSGWTDNPQGVDDSHPVEYVSSRRSVNGVWGPFGDPAVFATSEKIVKGINTWYGVFANGYTPTLAQNGNRNNGNFQYDTIADSVISANKGKSVWSIDEVTYNDKSVKFRNISFVGDCDKIGSVVECYAVTANVSTTPADRSWKTSYAEAAAQATQENMAMWSCDRVTYSDKGVAYLNKQLIGTVGKTGETPSVSTDVKYSTVTNSATQPSGSTFTSSSVPTLSKGSYLWCRETTSFTYKKNTSLNKSTTRYWVSRVGNDGDTGKGIHIAYATADGGRSGFSTTWFSGATYIGVCVSADAADPQTASSYEWNKIKGEDGNGILQTVIEYGLSSSGDVQPTSWSQSVLTPTDGQPWLWVRTTIYYTDGNNNVSYTKSYKGTDGTSITGPRGFRGPIIRKHADTDSEIKNGFSYMQGSDDEDYVDFIYKTSEDVWYRCIASYSASSAPNLSDSSRWKKVSTYKELATELLLAKNATIDMANSQQINLLDQNHSVFGSFRWVANGTDKALWLGNRFSVTRDGDIVSNSGKFVNASVSGTFEAGSGDTKIKISANDNIGGISIEGYLDIGYNAQKDRSFGNLYTAVFPDTGGHVIVTSTGEKDYFNQNALTYSTEITGLTLQTNFLFAKSAWLRTIATGTRKATSFDSMTKSMVDGNLVSCLIMNNTSELNIFLPSGPYPGQLFSVIQMGGKVNICMSSNHYIYNDASKVQKVSSSHKGQKNFFKFDGNDWHSMYFNGSF